MRNRRSRWATKAQLGLTAAVRRCARVARDERGSATVELAVALPAVAAVLLLGVAALQVVTTQVRVSDVAADYARAQARLEDGSTASSILGAVSGAEVTMENRGELLCATVAAPGGLPPFDGITVRATSCALEGGL